MILTSVAGRCGFHTCCHVPPSQQRAVDDSTAALEILARSSYVPDLNSLLAFDPDFPAKRA
jgi:hypothetical protein